MASTLSTRFFAELPSPMVIEIRGQDAAKVINNLCTNDIAKLKVNGSCEACITDLRGWVVAYGSIAKLSDRVLLIGQHTSPARVCQHIDRYVITEDAQVIDRSQDCCLLVASDLSIDVETELLERASGSVDPRFMTLADQPVTAVPSSIAGMESGLLVIDKAGATMARRDLEERGLRCLNSEEFELTRLRAFYPYESSEILEKTIPQELDRDRLAISFTKGCYLGQETIARLDARGQLQKKLCLIDIASTEASVGDELYSADKLVGQLSSVAADAAHGRSIGLATLRRGSFSPGTQLTCRGAAAVVVQAELP